MNSTLGTAVLTNTSSEVMVTSTTLDQPLIEVTNSRGQKNVVVSSMVNNDVYTLTLTDGSVVQLRVQNDLSSSQQQQQQHPQQLVHQQENIEFSPLNFCQRFRKFLRHFWKLEENCAAFF